MKITLTLSTQELRSAIQSHLVATKLEFMRGRVFKVTFGGTQGDPTAIVELDEQPPNLSGGKD